MLEAFPTKQRRSLPVERDKSHVARPRASHRTYDGRAGRSVVATRSCGATDEIADCPGLRRPSGGFRRALARPQTSNRAASTAVPFFHK